eukprot:5399841-Amphidinium_carterae.1
MLQKISLIDAAYPSLSWYARVPSASNPADDASRNRVDEVSKRFGARAIEVICPASVAEIGVDAWDLPCPL